MVKILKKFYKPFLITYVFLTIGLGFYPSFNFFSPKGQLILLGVAFFNGTMGVYIKKL